MAIKKSLSPLLGLVIHLQVPSTYEPARAQKLRPRCLDVLGYSIPPLPGLVLSSSKVCSIPSGPVVGLKKPQMKIK